MLMSAEVVFLLDVDNTLLDNDRFGADLTAHLDHDFGEAERRRYWSIYDGLRDQLGYADYLGALQIFRSSSDNVPALLQMSEFLLDYPFSQRLYPRAIAAIGHLRAMGIVKIPGTPEGVPAIEVSIFAGVPINVTLLFSCEQYLAAAEAYLRGIERRIEAGLDPLVASVASLFGSRWDVAVKDAVPADLRNTLGIAISGQTYRAYRELLESTRWRKLASAGAQPQRLLWAQAV